MSGIEGRARREKRYEFPEWDIILESQLFQRLVRIHEILHLLPLRMIDRIKGDVEIPGSDSVEEDVFEFLMNVVDTLSVRGMSRNKSPRTALTKFIQHARNLSSSGFELFTRTFVRECVHHLLSLCLSTMRDVGELIEEGREER